MNLQNLLNYDPTLLDGVNVPAPLSKELTQSAIVMHCGLLTPLYSEADTMKTLITLWFNTHQWNLDHLLAIVQAEYSPIENTDKHDEWTRTIGTERTGSSQNTRLDTGTYSGSETGRTDTETSGTTGGTTSGNVQTVTDRDTTGSRSENGSTTGETDTTASSTTEHTVSAFNATTYQPDSKDTASSTGNEQSQGTSTLAVTESGTDDSTVTETSSGTTSSTSSGTGSEERTNATSGQHNDTITDTGSSAGTEDTTETYTQHQHGNIGMTTNQQMITEEITLVKMFNIYDQIAAMLETDLFLGVY